MCAGLEPDGYHGNLCDRILKFRSFPLVSLPFPSLVLASFSLELDLASGLDRIDLHRHWFALIPHMSGFASSSQ